jgi:WD40 repeat protein
LNEFTWASGGEDQTAKVWDVRNVKEALFEWKTEESISNMRWSSEDKTLLWTVTEKLITVWDVCEQKAKFVHGGHLKRVTEMAVHPNLSDVFASADEDNSIHIFQPNKNYK